METGFTKFRKKFALIFPKIQYDLISVILLKLAI